MNRRVEVTEDQREIKRKKSVIEYAEKNGNIKTACRRFGIARSTFYLWRDRYRESGDEGLTDILSKCLDGIPAATMRKLKLDKAEAVTGRKFEPETFPRYANLKTATKADLEDLFGAWPPPVGTLPKVYRWTK